MGVPVIATEYLSGVGSCVLIVAAYLSLFGRRIAARFAMVGLLCTIPFWVVEPCKEFLHGLFSPILMGLFASFLLLGYLSLACSVRDLRTSDTSPHASYRQRLAVLVFSAVCVTVLCAVSYRQQKANERTPSRYVLPDGYVGWVIIHFQQSGFPSVPLRDGELEFDFPPNGVVRTNSQQQSGAARDHYFYRTSSGALTELKETGWGGGGMIWDESSGATEVPGGHEDRTEQFFVGNERQEKRMQNLPNRYEGIVAGDLREDLR